MQVILKWLKEEHQAKKRQPLRGAWKKEHARPVAQQDNSDDCGVFVLCHCRLLCEGRSCYFKIDPSAVRATVFKEILTCRLQKLPLDTVSVARSAVKLPKKTVSAGERCSVSKKVPVNVDGAYLLQSASISQRDKMFGERSNLQCTGIGAYFAGVSCCLLQESGEDDVNFSSEDLDAVVICKDEYYRECRGCASTTNVYLAVDELQPEMHTLSGIILMQWTLSAQGQFADVRTQLIGVVRDEMSSCVRGHVGFLFIGHCKTCLLYTSDAADE